MILYKIYIFMTIVMVVLLLLGSFHYLIRCYLHSVLLELVDSRY